MRSVAWNRSARVAEVRDQIWKHVSPSSRFESPGLLAAAALLKWTQTDALRLLGGLQFLLSNEVGEFLTAMPQLVRHLATASAREEQWTAERLHGPVQWSRTLALRAATGSQHIFVTAPAERVYQTPENELLVHVLDAIVQTARSSGWDQRGLARELPAMKVKERLTDTTRWQQSRMLSAVERVPPTPRSLSRIRTGRSHHRYNRVLAAYDLLALLVGQLDRQAIRGAIERAGLVAAEEATLFELLTTFRLVDELALVGWRLHPFSLFRGRVHTRGVRADGRRIQLWYQSTPPDLALPSQYRHVLAAHGFPRQQDLRPDLVLRWTDRAQNDRWLVIECKLRSTGVGPAAREALADLLTYRRAFNTTLAKAGTPYGLGVAWGEGLPPARDTEIALCTPDTLGDAVRKFVT